LPRAKLTAAEYGAALHILKPASANWSPPVVTYSALKGDGIAALWAHILDHRQKLTASGELAARRGEQQVKWMWAMLEERLFAPLRSDRALKAALPKLEAEVAEVGADDVLNLWQVAGRAHAQIAVMRGREMPGWLRVDPDGLRTKPQLQRWVEEGVAYARSLPGKPSSAR